jgi:hypothetical protein
MENSSNLLPVYFSNILVISALRENSFLGERICYVESY